MIEPKVDGSVFSGPDKVGGLLTVANKLLQTKQQLRVKALNKQKKEFEKKAAARSASAKKGAATRAANKKATNTPVKPTIPLSRRARATTTGNGAPGRPNTNAGSRTLRVRAPKLPSSTVNKTPGRKSNTVNPVQPVNKVNKPAGPGRRTNGAPRR
jgi:hypothetical protein